MYNNNTYLCRIILRLNKTMNTDPLLVQHMALAAVKINTLIAKCNDQRCWQPIMLLH